MLTQKNYFHVAFSCHRCAVAGNEGVVVKLSSAHKSLSLLVSFAGGTVLLGVSVWEVFSQITRQVCNELNELT